jgi:hypothetical protein
MRSTSLLSGLQYFAVVRVMYLANLAVHSAVTSPSNRPSLCFRVWLGGVLLVLSCRSPFVQLLLTILTPITLPLKCRLDKRFVNITGDNLVVDDYRIAINEDSEQGTCIV